MNFSYRLGRRIFREIARGLFDFRVIGEEKLHFPGPALIACNHVSFLDPPFVGQAFDEVVHSFARKSLFNHPLMGALLRSWQVLGVDLDKPDTTALKSTIRLLRSGEKVLIFPEGTRSFDGHLQPAEAGVGLFIAKGQAPVLPVRLFGAYEAYPRGAKTLRPARITLVIGDLWQPDLTSYSQTGKDLYQVLADEVMTRIASLSL
ncbi:lysophospholipid acyltransferase family protein [Prosthecobacter sp.]|uniref:lysophospholipid acyltransferase family protein n=1 Tax=Prosthecobacter sp. TaxID=1965333 RepID=UPI002ABA7CA5|nr:lysophospholipid acyltransferase family protein [Prosthecobacter sp.]MDZ4403222.1 lysophospholipid acyltransferase family protein [Prosthecobacter sp.]